MTNATDIEDFFQVVDTAPRGWVNDDRRLVCPACGAGVEDLRWPVPSGLRCLVCESLTSKGGGNE